MKNNWKLLYTSPPVPADQRLFPHLDQVVEDILRHRGIDSSEKIQGFLSPDYEQDLPDPFLLSDMELAVGRVLKALAARERICIYGDYDADGVTSAALLKDIFNQLSADTFCYIPERNKEGYGLNNQALDYIKRQGASLVITVDCGVSNIDEVEYARSLGIDVLILDHHHIPAALPKAVAVINPKKEGDPYPEKELAGVGVAFKFVQALVSKIPDYDKHQLKWLLDLVAIGTIADCVPLLGENRLIAKFGLIVLAKTKRVGLKQLFQVARLNIGEHSLPSSHQVAFQIAPRINAAGRMDHANTAYQLLVSTPEEAAEARVLALEIEAQNQHRQKVTDVIIKDVLQRLQSKTEIPKNHY